MADSFIFYLTFDGNLPETFYVFDSYLRKYDLFLVPIQIDQLQKIAASTEQEKLIVITSTTRLKDYIYFNKRVRHLLKYIMASPRLTFLHISSFSKLNDSNKFSILKNYKFIKLPVNPKTLAGTIAFSLFENSVHETKWPGGKRAGVRGVMA